jgi:glucose/arabinose dehydrogenase
MARALAACAEVATLPAAGTRVAALASGLDHPRWLYVLPNGNVIWRGSAQP